MNTYTPRRCGARWLDSDCPREVLAIIDFGPEGTARYDVIYKETLTVCYEGSSRIETWLNGFSITESGAGADHFEMQAHQVAVYRYRFRHRYTKWSTLPEAVKNAVHRDINEAAQYATEGE